jgi:hypothetical protein
LLCIQLLCVLVVLHFCKRIASLSAALQHTIHGVNLQRCTATLGNIMHCSVTASLVATPVITVCAVGLRCAHALPISSLSLTVSTCVHRPRAVRHAWSVSAFQMLMQHSQGGRSRLHSMRFCGRRRWNLWYWRQRATQVPSLQGTMRVVHVLRSVSPQRLPGSAELRSLRQLAASTWTEHARCRQRCKQSGAVSCNRGIASTARAQHAWLSLEQQQGHRTGPTHTSARSRMELNLTETCLSRASLRALRAACRPACTVSKILRTRQPGILDGCCVQAQRRSRTGEGVAVDVPGGVCEGHHLPNR